MSQILDSVVWELFRGTMPFSRSDSTSFRVAHLRQLIHSAFREGAIVVDITNSTIQVILEMSAFDCLVSWNGSCFSLVKSR